MIIDRDKLEEICQTQINLIRQNTEYLLAEWEHGQHNNALWTLRHLRQATGEAFESLALLQAAKLRELPFEPLENIEDLHLTEEDMAL